MESKFNLQVKIVITTQLFGTMENSPTEFSVESATWTNTSGFEQSVEVRTDAKSESGIVEGFHSMNISPGRDPYTVLRLFSSHVLLAVITQLLQTLVFYHVNDVKIHTSEQQLKNLGSHF